MTVFSYKTALIGAGAIFSSACATLDAPETVGLGQGAVSPVMTEHSFGLKCLGALIDDAGVPPVLVHVNRIRDRTIPPRLNDDGRLSQAGEWLFHTAISKMETPRVRSTLKQSGAGKEGRLLISGAWTQDDEVLRSDDGDIDGEIGRFRIGVDNDRRFDYVAGDFTSSKKGVVVFASAIGVMLSSGDYGARLQVENSGDFIDVSFDRRWADGPQMAQRRIAEAATLVHIARYYDINYFPCLEAGWATTTFYREAVERYAAASQTERNTMMQERLNARGYKVGSADGKWGRRSSAALMRYQIDRSLPVTGRPSDVLYGILSADLAHGRPLLEDG
ncbi:MAG: peptidoglycan-binding domain-containing protein [Pseudomonadota bacterium]